MNKKLAHTIFVFGDIVSIWILFIGYQEIRHTIAEITIYKDIVEFGNRDGFFILGIFLPLVHMLPIMDFIWPEIPKKCSHIVNRGFIIFTIVLIVSGFIVSSWMKSQVENSGYVYCRKASGVSALAKTLVYTKNMEICEEIVAADRQHTR